MPQDRKQAAPPWSRQRRCFSTRKLPNIPARPGPHLHGSVPSSPDVSCKRPGHWSRDRRAHPRTSGARGLGTLKYSWKDTAGTYRSSTVASLDVGERSWVAVSCSRSGRELARLRRFGGIWVTRPGVQGSYRAGGAGGRVHCGRRGRPASRTS